jgi:hypothetical protein
MIGDDKRELRVGPGPRPDRWRQKRKHLRRQRPRGGKAGTRDAGDGVPTIRRAACGDGVFIDLGISKICGHGYSFPGMPPASRITPLKLHLAAATIFLGKRLD